jgi:hypothetical protein
MTVIQESGQNLYQTTTRERNAKCCGYDPVGGRLLALIERVAQDEVMGIVDSRMVGHLEKARVSRIKTANSGIAPEVKTPRPIGCAMGVLRELSLPPQFSHVP